MAVIHLVRHGQASFGKLNYDTLSTLGVQQSRFVGAALSGRGIIPDVVVTGEMRRHRQTATELMEGAGWTCPVVVNPGWNEFDHQSVISKYRPAYRNPVVMAADLVRTLRPREAFQEMFELATDLWIESDIGYPETFAKFGDRVTEALETTTAMAGKSSPRPDSSRGVNIVVVTSAGPISWVASQLFGAGPDSWRRINRTAVNTGVTKIVVGERGKSLISLNEHTHLERHPNLITYR